MQNKNIFLKQVGSVLTGTAIAQIVPIVGSLLIARLYVPSDFGVFSAWLAIVMIVSTMLSCRYEAALVLVGDGAPRRNAFIATVVVTFLCALVASFILFMLSRYQISWLALFDRDSVLLLVPTAFFVALGQAYQVWAAANGEFRKLSKIRIIQAIWITVIQIVWGYFYPSALSLCLGYFAGNLISMLFVFYIMPCYQKEDMVESVFREGKNFLKKYKKFPLIALPAASINAISAQLPLIMVASNFGTDKAGYLALTMRVLGAPIGLLGKSVLDVFKRHASISYRETGSCQKEYIQTLKILMIASLVFAACTLLLGEQIFVLAYGADWRISGILALWLLPRFTMGFVASPLSYTVFLAEKQHVDLVWQIALLIATIGSLTIVPNFETAIISYSLIYAFLYIIYLWMSYRFSQKT